MIKVSSSAISCGVHQLVGVSDATDEELSLLLKGKFRFYYGSGYAPTVSDSTLESLRPGQVYIFSDCVGDPGPRSMYKNRHGQKLSDMIIEAGCGDLWEVGPFRNPNSRNQIKLWAWRFGKKPSQLKPTFSQRKRLVREATPKRLAIKKAA